VALYDQIDHAGSTDVGIRRSHNQDAFQVQKAVDRDHFSRVGHIFLVADGMGGHAVGEKASAKASREIPMIYAKHVHDGVVTALRRAFQEANAGIHAIGQENPEFRGLGTTATAIVIREEGAWIAHVGDSRAMRVRDGVLAQLSFDHSYVWEMARRMNIAPEELADVKKNVIIRSLGPDPLVQVDIEGPHPLQTGDIFILCSDGLSNVVEPDEIGAISAAFSPEEAGKILVELANLRGGPDNITVIIIKVGDSEASVMTSSMKTKKISALRRAFDSWNRTIPWPLSIIGIGFLFAVVFVLANINQWPGKMLWFALSSLTILGGLTGLILKVRKQNQEEEDEPENEAPRKLNIYRDYECHIHPDLIDRFQKLTNDVKMHLEAQKVQSDWKKFEKSQLVAKESRAEGDLLVCFREQIRALIILASTYNKTRQKEEGFKPKFGQGVDW
jgi:protein phosphatase